MIKVCFILSRNNGKDSIEFSITLTMISLIVHSCKPKKKIKNNRYQNPTPLSSDNCLNNMRYHLSNPSPWLRTIRILLQKLSKGSVRNEELHDLKITTNESQTPLVEVSSIATFTAVNEFFQSDGYKTDMHILNGFNLDRKDEKSTICGRYTSSLLVTWIEEIARKTETSIMTPRLLHPILHMLITLILTLFFFRDQYLHIKEDSRTRGVKLDFIIMKEDAQQLPLTSIIQRQYPFNDNLTCIELYTLLAIASIKYHTQSLIDNSMIYKV